MTNSESLVYKIDRIEVNDKYLTLWNYGDGLIKTISFPPPLAGISKEVESIANIAHGLDGSVHYLDDPEHDNITIDVVRTVAYDLLTKTILFLNSLPNE